MNWLTSFYRLHPEYRKLKVAKRSPTSVHFELEPGLYEAHFQIKPIYERAASNLWLPAGQLAALGRLIGSAVRQPRMALALVAGLPFATVLALQPDGTDGKDAWIVSSLPIQNMGVSTTMELGWYDSLTPARILFQFVLTTIPASATVSASVLTLVRQASYGTTAYSYGAYKLVQAWVEGTKDRATPADGVTWNTYNGTNNWGTAGCDHTTSDRSGTAENAHAINYAANNTWSIPTMTQDWVTTPANNKGLIILTTEAWSAQGYWVTYSSDHAAANWRPLLTITYSLAGGGGVFNAPFASPFRGTFG